MTDWKKGHYAIGPQDGSSLWHVGVTDARKCEHFESCRIWFPPEIEPLSKEWEETEAAVRAIGGWFTVTSYDDEPGVYTIEARRWVDPEPISVRARIFKQPLVAGLRALRAALKGSAR